MKEKEYFRSLRILLFLPLVIYICSYLYLAFYHEKAILFSTVIHEGGRYTFLETLFYASHFLGHIPVHTVLAFYFTGVFLCLDSEKTDPVHKKRIIGLLLGLFFLVAISLLISLNWFGTEDTGSFILQEKQSVTRYEQGGSWNLHLPSTLMQFLLIPIYIYGSKRIFRSKIAVNKSGIILISTSILLFVFMIWLVNYKVIASLMYTWETPRYLAHSVRELLTFPLTYYPIPLYFFLRNSDRSNRRGSGNNRLDIILMILSAAFLILFAYQVLVPLSTDIGDLAQKPSFAKNGELSILYLLASHYFEHFLDSIFFTLLSLTLYDSSGLHIQN